MNVLILPYLSRGSTVFTKIKMSTEFPCSKFLKMKFLENRRADGNRRQRDAEIADKRNKVSSREKELHGAVNGYDDYEPETEAESLCLKAALNVEINEFCLDICADGKPDSEAEALPEIRDVPGHKAEGREKKGAY